MSVRLEHIQTLIPSPVSFFELWGKDLGKALQPGKKYLLGERKRKKSWKKFFKKEDLKTPEELQRGVNLSKRTVVKPVSWKWSLVNICLFSFGFTCILEKIKRKLLTQGDCYSDISSTNGIKKAHEIHLISRSSTELRTTARGPVCSAGISG